MSLNFLGVDIAKSAIMANRKAIDVVGQNIANANNENYSRQEVVFTSNHPLYPPSFTTVDGAGQIGTGTDIKEIKRVRDEFIDKRVLDQTTQFNYYDKLADVLGEIESLFNEPSDSSIRAQLDSFFNSLHGLANNPENLAQRSVVKEQAEQLVGLIKDIYNEIQGIGGTGFEAEGTSALNLNIKSSVDEINGIAKEIAEINKSINAAIAVDNNNPNDLRDQRDALIKRLTELVDTRVESDDPQHRVLVGGLVLVQGQEYNQLELKEDNGKLKIYDKKSNLELLSSSGALGGLMKVRDDYIPKYLDKLDEFAVTFVDEFNQIHRSGFGLNDKTNIDFFDFSQSQDTNIYRIESSQTVLYPDKALDGDASTNEPENFEANKAGAGNIILNNTAVSYDGSTDTINDVIDRINSAQSGVEAYLSSNNKLVLRAVKEKDFKIESLQDTGNLLNTLGILSKNERYDYSDSDTENYLTGDITRPPLESGAAATVRVSKDITNDLNSIAAAAGIDTDLDGTNEVSKGPGDGSNAIAMANLRENTIFNYRENSFDDFYNSLVSTVAVDVNLARTNADSAETQLNNLKSIQQEVSGVSLDEEFTKLIRFQQGYNAAAKYLKTVDDMINTLIATFGV